VAEAVCANGVGVFDRPALVADLLKILDRARLRETGEDLAVGRIQALKGGGVVGIVVGAKPQRAADLFGAGQCGRDLAFRVAGRGIELENMPGQVGSRT
jgi:hypothetical protein